MASLIENVVSLEAQANKTVENAHVQAKDIENGVKVEVHAHQEALEKEVADRVDIFRMAAEARYNEELEAAQREVASARESVERLDAGIVRKQVARVVARFQEL